VDRKDSRLILWAAKTNLHASLTIYEELAESPWERHDFQCFYPVKIELVTWDIDDEKTSTEEKTEMELPKEIGLSLSRHFREWYGSMLTQATQLRQEVMGTDEELKTAKQQLLEARHTMKQAERRLATVLFLKTRQKCRNCSGFVYVDLERDWNHDGETECTKPEPSTGINREAREKEGLDTA